MIAIMVESAKEKTNLVILILETPLTTINAELVRRFSVAPTKKPHPDPYAIYAVYGKGDSERIYTGEREQCEAMLKRINAKLDPSGHDQIELTPQRE